MKKNVFVLIAITFLAFISCTNEVDITQTDLGSGESITFSLPGATTHQPNNINVGYAIHLHDLMIFMFDKKTGSLEQVFYTGDIVFDHQDEVCTATIQPGRLKGEKTFYFVANSVNKSSGLNNLKPGNTRISDITRLITENVNPNQTSLLLSGKTEISNIHQTRQPVWVDLECRAARFDLADDPIFDDFRINNIQVINTSLQTHIFSDNASTNNNTFKSETYKLTNFMDKKAFYLYPGILGKGYTELIIEGSYKGEEATYYLIFPSNIEIEADKRYSLKPQILDNQLIKAEVKVGNRSATNEHSTIQIGITVMDYTLIESGVIL